MQKCVASLDKALRRMSLRRIGPSFVASPQQKSDHTLMSHSFRDPGASEAPTRLIDALASASVLRPSEVLLSHRGVMIETRRMHEAGTEAEAENPFRVLDVCIITNMVQTTNPHFHGAGHAPNVVSCSAILYSGASVMTYSCYM